MDLAGRTAVVFLACDAAPSICGHEGVIDGGMTTNGYVVSATES